MSNFLAQYIVDFATFLPSEESVRGVIADASRLTTGFVAPERLAPDPVATKVLFGNNTWGDVSTVLPPDVVYEGDLAAIAFTGSATDLISGTVPLLRLPSQVARTDLSNIFAQGNTFQATQVFEASICVGAGGLGPRIRQGTGQVFRLNNNTDTARADLEAGAATFTGAASFSTTASINGILLKNAASALNIRNSSDTAYWQVDASGISVNTGGVQWRDLTTNSEHWRLYKNNSDPTLYLRDMVNARMLVQFGAGATSGSAFTIFLSNVNIDAALRVISNDSYIGASDTHNYLSNTTNFRGGGVTRAFINGATGAATFGGALTLPLDVWHKDSAGAEKFAFATGGINLHKAANRHEFRNNSEVVRVQIPATGNALNVFGNINASNQTVTAYVYSADAPTLTGYYEWRKNGVRQGYVGYDSGNNISFTNEVSGYFTFNQPVQVGGTAGHILRWNAGASSLEVRDSTNSFYRKTRVGELQVLADLGGSNATPSNARLGFLTQIGGYIAGAISGRTYSANATHGDIVISASLNMTLGQNDYSGLTDDLVLRGNTGNVEINRGNLRIGTTGGPRLKNSSGTLQVRNDADSDFAPIRASMFVGQGDDRLQTMAAGQPWQLLTGAGSALGIKVGNLVVSNSYSDTAPTNGLFVKGSIVSENQATIRYGLSIQDLSTGIGHYLFYKNPGDNSFYFRDLINSRMQMTFNPGSTSSLATTIIGSKLTVDSSAIFNSTVQIGGGSGVFLQSSLDNLQVRNGANTGYSGIFASRAFIGKQYFGDTCYSFSNGYLIATDIPATADRMIEFTIEGNTYDNAKGPSFTRVQAYNYNSGPSTIIINQRGMSTDKDLTFEMFHYNGFVYAWFTQTSLFQTYTIKLISPFVDHIITSITNAAKPTVGVTNSVTVPMLQWWNQANDGAGSGMDADLLDGQHGSYYATASSVAGTLNYVPKFTSSSAIGNSQIFDDGTNVGIGTTTLTHKLTINGTLGVTSGYSYLYGAAIQNPGDGPSVQMNPGRLSIGGAVAEISIQDRDAADNTFRSVLYSNGGLFRVWRGADRFTVSSTSTTVIDQLNVNSGIIRLGTSINPEIGPGTSDGSDNRILLLVGGGAYGPTTRGAHISVHGLDSATRPGNIELWAGQNGDIRLGGEQGGGHVVALTVRPNGSLRHRTNVWHQDDAGANRYYYTNNGTTFYTGHGSLPHGWRNSADGTIMTLGSGGQLSLLDVRPIVITPALGTISIQASTGGWANDLRFLGSAGTHLTGFGATGTNDALSYAYIGIFGSEVARFAAGGLMSINMATQSGRSLSILPQNTADRSGIRIYDYGSFNSNNIQSGLEVVYLGGTFASPTTTVSGHYRNLVSFRTGGSSAALSNSPSFAIRSTIGDLIGSALSEVNTSFMVTPTSTGVTIPVQTIYGNTGLVDFPVGQVQLGTNVRLKNNAGELQIRNSGDTDFAPMTSGEYEARANIRINTSNDLMFNRSGQTSASTGRVKWWTSGLFGTSIGPSGTDFTIQNQSVTAMTINNIGATTFSGDLTTLGRLIVSTGTTGATLQATFTNTTSSQPAGFRLNNGVWDIGFRTNPSNGWFEITDSSGNIQHRWHAKDYLLASTGKLYFSSESNFATSGIGAQDVSIGRASAGVLRVYNSAGGDGSIQAASGTFSGALAVTPTVSITSGSNASQGLVLNNSASTLGRIGSIFIGYPGFYDDNLIIRHNSLPAITISDSYVQFLRNTALNGATIQMSHADNGNNTIIYNSSGNPGVKISALTKLSMGIALTEQIALTSSSLTIVPNTSFSGDVSVTGSITNVHTKTYNVTRTLPSTAGDYVDIGTFVHNNGAGFLDVTINVGLASNSQTKCYKIPCFWSATTNNWRKFPAISSSPTFSGNDFDLEIRGNTSMTDLRIRKTAGSVGGTIQIAVVQYGRVDIDYFTPSTATGSGGAPTTLAAEYGRENLVIRGINGLSENLLTIRNGSGTNVATVSSTGQFSMANGVEHTSIGDGLTRMFFNTSGTTIFRGHGSEIFIMQNSAGSNMLSLGSTGNVIAQGSITCTTPSVTTNSTIVATTSFVNSLAVNLFNNMNATHGTNTDFNGVTNFGCRYVQGNTNGPGTGSSQFYSIGLGLGTEYAFSQYALQLAVPRYNSSDKYLSMRTREAGTWGSWYKIAAGTADGLREFTWSGKPTASSTKGPIMITDTVPANTIWTSDGTVWRSQTRTRKTITYAATLTLDSSEAMVQRVTLTGNLTLNKFTNPFDGAALEVILRQDGVGGRTLTFGTGFRFNDYITSITLSTAANKTDRILFEYDAVDDVWDVISFVKGS